MPEQNHPFATLVEALRDEPNVAFGGKQRQRFGHSALTVNGKIFAMASPAGTLVVKLPKARVDELVTSGAARNFGSSNGRPMKEWAEVAGESGVDWLALAREALAFVRAAS